MLNFVASELVMVNSSFIRVAASSALGLAIGLASVPAAANSPFSKIVSFGDSLTDTGNFLEVSTVLSGLGVPGFATPLPQAGDYFNGRFSNGRVAVEVLADGLKGTLNDGQSLFLENYAYGGAQTGQNGVLPNTGMRSQLLSYQKSPQSGVGADSDALYFVWGGGNDLRSIADNPGNANQIVGDALINLGTIVGTLYQMGARNFLLPNLPDLSLTPEVLQSNDPMKIGQAKVLSETFNGLLNAQVITPLSAMPGINLMTIDVMQSQRDILGALAANGLTNGTEACFAGFVGLPSATPKCANPNAYFYWDTVHPTARTHEILGGQMLAAVPEPATMLMMGAGVLGLLAMGRRRRQG